MDKLDDSSTTCYQSVNKLIESIALEEVALANVINAEGAKIQKAVSMDVSIDELLAINKSVSDTISNISLLEMVLLNKLRAGMQCTTVSTPPPQEECAYIRVYVCVPNVEILIYSRKNDQVYNLVDEGKTNADGEYLSDALPLGEYVVHIMDLGEIAYEKSISLSVENEIKNIDACNSNIGEPINIKYAYIEGCVFDKCGRPLANVKIVINEKTSYSNSKGYFVVKDIYAGTDLIVKAYHNNVVIYNSTLLEPIKNYYKLCITTS